nr:hypothetical protein [Tanacetum cinerariifolium]
MKIGDIPKPKKKKKAAAPTQSESSLTKDNEVSDNDEDLKYANQVSIEEFEKQEKERRTKHRHTIIVLERQVNKEVDEEHNKSDNDSNRGDKSDKTSSDEESSEYDESDKDSDNGANQTRALMIKPTLSPSVTTLAKDVSRYLIEPPKIQMTKILNEPVHTEIDEQEARFGSTKPSQSKRTHDDQDDPDNSEGEKKSKRRPKYAGESSSKKSKAQEVPPYFKTCNDADEPRQEDEPRPDNKQVHKAQEAHIDKILEEPEEYEYRDGSVTQFGKLVKKIFKKDVIRKDDVDGELYKFSDGTLNKVLSKLEIILRNNKVGYNNEGMEKYYWIKDDDKNTRKFVKKIEKALKERRRFRRLELFVGGRRDKTDYRLLIRPE